MAKTRRTTKPQSEINKEATPRVDIAPLVRRAQLRYLRLRKSESVLLAVPENPSELHQTIQVEVGPSDAEPKAICVQATFTLDGRDALRIVATFEILYEYDASIEVTTEQMAVFGHLIGVNNAWPYWRELIQSMTSRMGLPSLTLPLFRPPVHSAETEQKKASQSKKKKHTTVKKKPRKT